MAQNTCSLQRASALPVGSGLVLLIGQISTFAAREKSPPSRFTTCAAHRHATQQQIGQDLKACSFNLELRFRFIMSTSCEALSSCPIPSRSNRSPLLDSYSQTPGGTVFSTTPGGTRIIYDRKFLLECRNSPIAHTPPCCLPHIPGVTRPSLQPAEQEDGNKDLAVDDNQFVMDM